MSDRIQDSLISIRRPSDGMHDISELKARQADGWFVTQMISDCESVIVYIIEKGGPAPEQ